MSEDTGVGRKDRGTVGSEETKKGWGGGRGWGGRGGAE